MDHCHPHTPVRLNKSDKGVSTHIRRARSRDEMGLESVKQMNTTLNQCEHTPPRNLTSLYQFKVTAKVTIDLMRVRIFVKIILSLVYQLLDLPHLPVVTAQQSWTMSPIHLVWMKNCRTSLSLLFRNFNSSIRTTYLFFLSNKSNMVSLIDYYFLVDDGMVPIFDSVTYN